MKSSIRLASTLFAGLLTIGTVSAQTIKPGDKATASDNTAANASDRDTNATTPIDQANNKEAIETTAEIRRAVMNDKSLSTSAHNIKIITNGDTVTIRGPVSSADEKKRIEALALKSAPGKQVRNELSIAG